MTFYLTNRADDNDDREKFFKYTNHCPPLPESKDEAEQSGKQGGGVDKKREPVIASSTALPPSEEGIWILKPASRTNRGFGIKVVKGVSEVS